ncbi:distal tail protein Dit [Helcococcus bovis]|uniref:distal tail protein Dit n=1 Tax=Helcococcus bovis TaxID=3153252 RepID=UPI0038B9E32C
MADFIYNNTDLSKFVKVEDIRRPLVSVSNTYYDLPGKEGAYFLKRKLNSKPVEVDIRLIEEVFNKNINETKDILLSSLLVESPKKLELKDYKDRYEMAILDGEIDFQKFLNTGFITLKFINPDGVFYSKEEYKSLNNIGNLKAPFKLRGQISKELVTITNNKTLEKITINTSGMINKTIEVDTGLEAVYIDNKNAMRYVFLDSDFFYLSKGENSIKLEGITSPIYRYRARWA